MTLVLVDIAGHHYWTDDGSFLPMDIEPRPSDTIATFPDLLSAEEEMVQQRTEPTRGSCQAWSPRCQ